MNHVIIIPARYQSSRLPGKPLVDIAGVPMIIRTWRQCVKATSPESIYVATDDQRIASVCRDAGIQVLMTSSHCLTGTDRVAEAAKAIDADVYINVQGDEPAFNPRDITRLIDTALEHPDLVINGYCTIEREEQFRSPSVPKVVFRPDGRLLYMSRAPIPMTKQLSFVKSWRQVCAYAFPRNALHAFASIKEKTALEQIEDIEILRFLELGWEVRMIELSQDSVAVDNPDDIQAAEEQLRRLGIA